MCLLTSLSRNILFDPWSFLDSGDFGPSNSNTVFWNAAAVTKRQKNLTLSGILAWTAGPGLGPSTNVDEKYYSPL